MSLTLYLYSQFQNDRIIINNCTPQIANIIQAKLWTNNLFKAFIGKSGLLMTKTIECETLCKSLMDDLDKATNFRIRKLYHFIIKLKPEEPFFIFNEKSSIIERKCAHISLKKQLNGFHSKLDFYNFLKEKFEPITAVTYTQL
ncbi:MAG: hypothetical protein K2O88_01720, partial [Paramuribaculum sp.]|nr:hypothetical protein [Paramuribaculum sp.]